VNIETTRFDTQLRVEVNVPTKVLLQLLERKVRDQYTYRGGYDPTWAFSRAEAINKAMAEIRELLMWSNPVAMDVSGSLMTPEQRERFEQQR
jgi:hypothetical protein